MIEYKSIGGDLPDVSVLSDSLQPTDASLGVTITTTVLENGGILWSPLRSDQLRTLHDSPQVRARFDICASLWVCLRLQKLKNGPQFCQSNCFNMQINKCSNVHINTV